MTIRIRLGLHKLWRLGWRDRLLLLEAVLWLTMAGITLATIPFRHIGKLAALPVTRPEPTGRIRIKTIERVRWAIMSAVHRLPWRAMCFEQGLVAQLMLRRRGVPSVLYYGIAREDQKGLAAHVWVREVDVDIIGCEIASKFTVLATFPPMDKSQTQLKPEPPGADEASS